MTFQSGPLERIVNVQWPNSGLIGVFQFSYNFISKYDLSYSARLSSPLLSLGTGEVLSLTPVKPAPDIPSGLDFWVYTPHRKETSTSIVQPSTIIDRANYYVNMTIGRLIGLVNDGQQDIWTFSNRGQIIIPNVTFHPSVSVPYIRDFTGDNSGGAFTTSLQEDELFLRLGIDIAAYGYGPQAVGPVLKSVVSSHVGPTTTVISYAKTGAVVGFVNLGRIKSRNAGPLKLILNTVGVSSIEHLDWTASVSTYKTTKTFPVKADNSLKGPYAKGDPVDGKELTCGLFSERAVPSFLSTFNINLDTLKVTASKVATS